MIKGYKAKEDPDPYKQKGKDIVLDIMMV